MRWKVIFVFGVLVALGFFAARPRPEAPTERAPASAPKSVTPEIFPKSQRPRLRPKLSVASASERIDELIDCQSENRCPFGGRDSKDTFYIASQKIAAALTELLPLAKDPGEEGEELERLATRMMSESSDEVQAAALGLLSALPQSDENLQAILNGLKDSNDPSLYENAMRTLHTYNSPGDRETIVRFLGDAMIHGAPSVSQVVSQNLRPFLGEDTTPIVEEDLAQLPPDSIRRARLSAALGLRNDS